MTRILIVDDHQMFIDGIKSLLGREESIELAAEALTGEEAVKLASNEKIDIILMDVNMPGTINGLEASRQIKEKHPEIKILLLTMYCTRDFIEKALEINADGYILKNTGKEELLQAIETLGKGEKFYSDEVQKSFMESFGKRKSATSEFHLSKREIEVLKLVAQGLTTANIAEKLFISQHTVDTHRKNLLSKLGLNNAASLVKYAIHNGFA